jgi:hypothetical protein
MTRPQLPISPSCWLRAAVGTVLLVLHGCTGTPGEMLAAGRHVALETGALGGATASGLSCRTEISGDPAHASVHYMAYGDFADQKSTSWLSYESGTRLDIGLYQFRVTPRNETAYYSTVLILSDPFQRRLKRERP